jgi:ArsR family metal-binding transcriptional regulator
LKRNDIYERKGQEIMITVNEIVKITMVNIKDSKRKKSKIWILNELHQADKEFDENGGQDISAFAKKFKLGKFKENFDKLN